MSVRPIAISLIGLLFLTAVVPTAFAETFKSKEGYSLEIPDGWGVATASDRKAITDEIQGNSQFRQIDFKAVDAFIFDPGPDGFAASINVVVVPESVPVRESELGNLELEVKAGYTNIGVTIDDMTSAVERYADRDCYVVTYRSDLMGKELYQKQYFVPSKGKSFVVTGTSLYDDRDAYLPKFEAAMKTFDAEKAGFSMPGGIMRYVIIAAVVGVVFVVISAMKKKTTGLDSELTD